VHHPFPPGHHADLADLLEMAEDAAESALEQAEGDLTPENMLTMVKYQLDSYKALYALAEVTDPELAEMVRPHMEKQQRVLDGFLR